MKSGDGVALMSQRSSNTPQHDYIKSLSSGTAADLQVGPLLKSMFEACLAHTPAAPRLEESYRLLYQEQAGPATGPCPVDPALSSLHCYSMRDS